NRLGRRHRLRGGQIIHERRAEERLRRVFLDLLRVVVVYRDFWIANERRRLLRREDGRQAACEHGGERDSGKHQGSSGDGDGSDLRAAWRNPATEYASSTVRAANSQDWNRRRA